ncbi:MAG: hypothetical protein CMO99_02305 [Woeseiaceae bacterium]|nr:hypothetical protein [Woeseiaceae bacterium]
MNKKKILVIGAGLMGITSAYELMVRGYEVTLIDELDSPASSASYANAGMLTPSMPEPWNGPGVYKNLIKSLFNADASMRLRWHAIPGLMDWGIKFLKYSSKTHFEKACRDNFYLTSFSLKKTQETAERLNLDYCRGKLGTLSIFRHAEDFLVKQSLYQSLNKMGMNCDILETDEIIHLVPALSEMKSEIYKGIHFYEDEFGDAHLFCCELLENFIDGGGEVKYGEVVSKINIKNENLIGITTSNGLIESDNILVCAGAKSPIILGTANINLDVKPAKGYSVTTEIQGLKELLPLPVLDDSMNIVFTPLGNRLRMVSTAEFAGYDNAIDKKRIEMMLESLNKILPRVFSRVNKDNILPWTGHRPMSCDGKPFIGESKIKGLYVNCGQGPLGWTLAMGSANLIADIISRKKPAIDPMLFSMNRLAK